MTFRKGSTRHKILEGLRELNGNSILKFMKIFGSQDPHVHQTVHEVIAAIPRNRLAEALVVVERRVKKIDRTAIQNAAKLYIERVNHEGLAHEENRDAIKESTVTLLPTNKRDIVNIVEAMGKMSHEIILSGIDTLIAGKGGNTHEKWDVTPEEIEKFMSSMREGVDPVTGIKVSKIGFFKEAPKYGVITPVDDLVLRSDGTSPVLPETDFHEFEQARGALLEEVYALAAATRDTGWFDDDTPGIPKEKFSRAIEFLFMLPEGRFLGYLPHGVTASPDGVVTFWWKNFKKKVTFAITNYANFSWQLKYTGNIPQDTHDRFCMLTREGIEYLIIDLKKMYS